MLEPYADENNGQRLFMTSLSIPLQKDGRTVGVIGVDISLDSLQKAVSSSRATLFEGAGRIAIVANGGTIAADSANAGNPGLPIGKVDKDNASKILGALGAQSATQFDDAQDVQVVSPVTPIPGGENWGVSISVPKQVLFKKGLAIQSLLTTNQKDGLQMALVISLVVLVLSSLLVWAMANQLVRPLIATGRMLEDIASGEGDLTRRLEIRRHDELVGILVQ